VTVSPEADILDKNEKRQRRVKKFIGFICIFILSCCNNCFAEIIQANDITIIQKALKSADKDTLVIFDVDDVLLIPKDQILLAQNKKYLEELNSKLEQSVGQENANVFYSIIFQQRQNGPVDAKKSEVISGLQAKGIKVLALTNCFTGKFGNIKSMEDWRYGELSKNDYHFDRSWPTLKAKIFEKTMDNGLSPKSNSNPTFFKGIVFTNSVSKGEALQAFLKYANFTPKKIIFIDDKKKHLETVENITLAHNIPFVGIEYTVANQIQNESLNTKRADLQYEILENEKKWISDSQADALLNSQK